MAIAFQPDGYVGAITQEVDNALNVNVGTSSTERVAMPFTTTLTRTYNVEAKVAKNGTPVDDLVVEVQTEAAGIPSGTVVGTSISTVGTTLPTTVTWTKFATLAPLTASTRYWLVLRRSGATSSANHYFWAQATTDVYASHGRSIYASSAWGAETADRDLNFRVYAGGLAFQLNAFQTAGDLPILVMSPPGRRP